MPLASPSQIRWTRGRQLPEDVAENLSASEVQYFRNYDKCLVACNKAVGLDLTTDVEPPTAGISRRGRPDTRRT